MTTDIPNPNTATNDKAFALSLGDDNQMEKLDTCATIKGYNRHLKRHEPTCQPCRDAWYEYCMENEAKKKTPLALACKAFLAKKAEQLG